MTKQSKTNQVLLRGELMAELFLQGLEPKFLAEANLANLPFDFFVGFSNSKGGVNTFAVEVKATENDIRSKYRLRADVYKALAYSNIPVLLLVVNVKDNLIYYSWPCENKAGSRLPEYVNVPVALIDDDSKNALVAQMQENQFSFCRS